MFERYTEKARRVIFFARYEASQFGASQIEAEHILLGLLREDKSPFLRNLCRSLDHESVRRETEGRMISRDRTSVNIDLPLSIEAKRVLTFATEESEKLRHRHIGTEHLLLGLLREESSVAAEILYENGIRLTDVREALERGETSTGPHSTQSLAPDWTLPQDIDERWMFEVSKACIDLGIFTQSELMNELTDVSGLRRFRADVEALLRVLAEKGLADRTGLPALAVELRDEKKLVEFIERLRLRGN
jgi:ATP-dependent Clp protease ATP-binding subunit ClpA